MSEEVQQFRRKAAECEHEASRVTLPANRRIYLELAERWRRMAEQAEIFERMGAAAPTESQ
jgi:hypothetical protein